MCNSLKEDSTSTIFCSRYMSTSIKIKVTFNCLDNCNEVFLASPFQHVNKWASHSLFPIRNNFILDFFSLELSIYLPYAFCPDYIEKKHVFTTFNVKNHAFVSCGVFIDKLNSDSLIVVDSCIVGSTLLLITKNFIFFKPFLIFTNIWMRWIIFPVFGIRVFFE